jgi:predicted nucleic acid-binding protein
MNLLDSSGWIEYFVEGPNAERFASVLDETARLLVPTIVLQEVYRWVDREGGELAASRAMATMQTGTVMDLDTDLALASARLAPQHRRHTADLLDHAAAHSPGALGRT